MALGKISIARAEAQIVQFYTADGKLLRESPVIPDSETSLAVPPGAAEVKIVTRLIHNIPKGAMI